MFFNRIELVFPIISAVFLLICSCTESAPADDDLAQGALANNASAPPASGSKVQSGVKTSGACSPSNTASHASHSGQPSKQAEHQALMRLVPAGKATSIAYTNGSWFNQNIWCNGTVPGANSKVLIPSGVTVEYDAISNAPLFTVRVDGILKFSPSVDTRMKVDTLVVTPGGKLVIGDKASPVRSNARTSIEIADNGPIDVAWDPFLLSRGLISHGDISIHGAEKTPFLRVSAPALKGATSLVLESAPKGWRIGDRLVLTGTHLHETPHADAGDVQKITTEDEERVITAISGNVVDINLPLKYDHTPPRSDLKAYVANMTRNVRIATENHGSLPPRRRGHVMFMHSNNVDVRYAEFHQLGRTDKSRRAHDVAKLPSVVSSSNVKGRYPLHIHRAGVADQKNPARLIGNTVWGSPGWGVTHHDSHALIIGNAVYDAFGAGFVAESGNETGRWVRNIAIRSTGVGGGPKHGADVTAFDLGRTGAGFWFQGRIVAAVENVAASIPAGQGFIYMSRGQHTGAAQVLSATIPQPETSRYLKNVKINIPAISQFYGNEAFGVEIGLQVIKNGPQQHHDIRTVIENFKAWEAIEGIHLQYTGHYTVLNADLLGSKALGLNNKPLGRKGINLHSTVHDITINGGVISDFNNGVFMTRHSVLPGSAFNGNLEYAFVGLQFIRTNTKFVNLSAQDRVLGAAALVPGRLNFNPDIKGVATLVRGSSILFSGTKTDQIGAHKVSPNWDRMDYDFSAVMGALQTEGYWTLPDSRTVTNLEYFVADRATGDFIKLRNVVAFSGAGSLSGFSNNGVLNLNNKPPAPRPDRVSVTGGQPIRIDVLSNDSDPDGDKLIIDGHTRPHHGRLLQNGLTGLTYEPDVGYRGLDKFFYWAKDTHGNLSKSEVTISVSP